ncbi:MAG: archaemetzincin family Zn-dependent metalloprotease [candidate division Zixibacteria bacterium]|nr:archaemetzincin family Zn-dependent metalloprotease [candidate division Zixibacteria bacterium]
MKPGIFCVTIFLVILGCSTNEFQYKGEKQEVKSKQGEIYILGINKVDSTLLEKLRTNLEKIFGQKIKVSLISWDLEFAYNPERKQYYSSAILEKLRNAGSEAGERVLGLVDIDLYVPDLNFVFGEADVVEKIAVISTKRLRQEYYGLPKDEQLLLDRTLKESVHELGHTYGLGHCPDKSCVMYFSNSLQDTDFKSSSFCESCKSKLMLAIRSES